MIPYMIVPVEGGFYKTVFCLLSAVSGLCVGSFLNVVIYRLPRGLSLVEPPSHCTRCGRTLRFYDNIPILSYCFLRGKCRYCGARIPFRYTAVELSNMLLWLACALMFSDNVVYAVIAACVCSVCICVFFIDFEFMIIHDRFQVALGVSGAASVFVDTNHGPKSHIAGMMAAASVFILLALIVGKIMKREALGGGDIKFALCSGLLLGIEKLIIMMLIASVSASIVLCLRRKKDGKSEEKPFGPFLCAGLLIALFFGDGILRIYLSLLPG